jgi:hypothetical protein
VSNHRLSATCCGESLKNPILPIVYLLIQPARHLDALKPKREKARAETVPIYIHINTNTFIYMSVLFCVHLGLCLYLLSLIILYFSYIGGILRLFCLILYALQGVTLTGRYTVNGGHSCQNLPVLWTTCPHTQGELRSSPLLRLASSAVQPNQTHSSNADYPSHKPEQSCVTPTQQPTT